MPQNYLKYRTNRYLKSLQVAIHTSSNEWFQLYSKMGDHNKMVDLSRTGEGINTLTLYIFDHSSSFIPLTWYTPIPVFILLLQIIYSFYLFMFDNYCMLENPFVNIVF